MRNVTLLLLLMTSVVGCGATRKAYVAPPPEASVEAAPQDDRGMYLSLLQKMQEQGAYFASLAHIDAFRQRFGETPDLRILQANALRETGDVDDAANIYRSLLKTPQAAAAWHGLGLISAARNDTAAAELALANAARMQPLDTRYLGDLGFLRLKAGHYADARGPLAKAAELEPGNPKAISNLALWALLADQSNLADSIIAQGELSAAAREEIRRLAAQLRKPKIAPSEPTAATIVETDRTSSAAVKGNHPTPPISMLERFASPASHSTETLP